MHRNHLHKSRNGIGVSMDDELRVDVPAVDIVEFAGEDFKPEAYIQMILSSTSEDGVRAFYDNLRESKELAASDLQRNVYKNYNEFVTISKEISNILSEIFYASDRTFILYLESDMFVLRGLLNELRNVSNNLREDSSAESATTDTVATVTSDPIIPRGRKPVSNNAADLQSIWKAQIEALWEGVEGAQRLVPLEPGRHIIRESSSFVEINPATNKPKQGVQMFLLNDCLLVAVKKKRGAMSLKVKLIAERCWGLNEITLIDMKDTSEHQNLIKILKHPVDTFIYKADKPEEKKNLISMTRRAAEVMMVLKTNGLDQERNTDSIINVQNQQLSPLLRSIPRRSRSPASPLLGAPRNSVASSKEVSLGDSREIADLADQLDVNIAHREYDEAVENIERAKVMLNNLSLDPGKLDAIRRKMDERVVRLSNAIGRDLTNPDLKKSQVQKNVRWLLRLGYGEQARQMFLGARSKIIRIQTKQLKFEGDIPRYINDLSLVYFTLVKNTCDWYNAAFRDLRMSSGLVKWAKEEMEHYAGMFRRQVYSMHDPDAQISQECLKINKDHCSILREVGLDLKFYLDKLLDPNAEPPAFNHDESGYAMTVVIEEPEAEGSPDFIIDNYGSAF
ncbi:8795_t:CDS:10 [Ambispora leptoticha]|uniref:Exocyst complex component EXO84 n=1 Tax=Ambispora leptoticha TaxID=144679 RepID=A0A9N8VKY4_9GLOM|nr:8795_t:CDS:10 [Ambispora leptoticha]